MLLSLPSLEDYPRWLAGGNTGVILIHLAIVGAGIAFLGGTTAVYYWQRRIEVPNAAVWFVAGLDVAYLFLPLVHHLFFSRDEGSWLDRGYFVYISDADNYFARSLLVQIGVWVGVGLIVIGVTRVRLWLSGWRRGAVGR